MAGRFLAGDVKVSAAGKPWSDSVKKHADNEDVSRRDEVRGEVRIVRPLHRSRYLLLISRRSADATAKAGPLHGFACGLCNDGISRASAPPGALTYVTHHSPW